MQFQQFWGIFLCSASLTAAASLPTCGTQFDYSCAAPTLGGYTFVNPLPAQGATEITGYNSSNVVIFHQIIPAPPNGPAGADVQLAVLHAQNQIAVQSGLLVPPATGSMGGSVVVTASTSQTYVALDTPITQRADQYSTTLIFKLGASVLLTQNFSLPFADPSVQAAIAAASFGSTVFGAPILLSGSTSPVGSQMWYQQTGVGPTGNSTITTTNTFGPAFLSGHNCLDLCPSPDVIFYVAAGQLDIDVHTNQEFAISRNVITTNTFLTTQLYEVDGVASGATPEPATWALFATGIVLAAVVAQKRKS